MTDYNLTISVNHEGIPPLLDVIQGDSGRNIVITVADMNVTGYTARVYAVKPSGLDVYNNAVVSGGKITVALTTQMLAEVGNTKMQVNIYDSNSKRVSTFIIWLNVQTSLQSKGMINSSTEYQTLDGLIEEAQDATAEARAAANKIGIPLPVTSGGTEKTSHTVHSVLIGNAHNPLKNVASTGGAFYSTGENILPKFGTLLIPYGGTGATSGAEALANLGGLAATAMESGTVAAPGVRLSSLGGITYSNKSARYWVHGDLCIVQFNMAINSVEPSISGVNLYLSELPVTPAAYSFGWGYLWCANLATDATVAPAMTTMAGGVRQDGTALRLYCAGANSNYAVQMHTDMLKNATTISGLVIYKV